MGIKRSYIGFIIILFLTVCSYSVLSAWCTDSDSRTDGFDSDELYVYGCTVNDKGVKSCDTCRSTSTIREYYCQYNDYWFKDRVCPPASDCLNGKCVKSSNSCSNECSSIGQKTCYGSTGYKVCGNYDSDKCLEWSSVKSCSSGYRCSNGQCVASSPSCSHECSFTGQKGCYGSAGYKVCGNYDSDKCLEWSSVKSCSSGYRCSNGQCITPCTDSDSGNNEWKKGTVSSSTGYHTDYCSTSSLCPSNSEDVGRCLLEYFCSGNQVLQGYTVCDPGYECMDGACVKERSSSLMSGFAFVRDIFAGLKFS